MVPTFIDRNKTGFLGIFWKCARIGERLSPWVSLRSAVVSFDNLKSFFNIQRIQQQKKLHRHGHEEAVLLSQKRHQIEIILNLTNIVQFRSLVFLPLDK